MNKKKKLPACDIIIAGVMIILTALTLIPCLTVLAKAFSDPVYVLSGQVTIFPKGFQLGTVGYVLTQPEFINAFKTTVTVTVFGTTFAMFLTVSAAYPLSKPSLRGRKIFLGIYVFVMLFNAGMVPNYINFRSLKLINTVWAIVFNGAFSVSNMFIIKNYFESLPESIEESARIDGASNITTLLRVVIPMSTPVLATIALFYGVGYWNSYISSVMYISKPELRTLQHYLYELVSLASQAGSLDQSASEAASVLSTANIRSAVIVLSTLPILVLYPYLQKFFVKGITVGSVKG